MDSNSNQPMSGDRCAPDHSRLVRFPVLVLGVLAFVVLSVSAQISVPGSALGEMKPETDVEPERATDESEPLPPEATEDGDDPLASLRAFSQRQAFFSLSEESVDIGGDALPGSLGFGRAGTAGGEVGVGPMGSGSGNGDTANLFISLMDATGDVGTVRETSEGDTSLIQASVDDSMRGVLDGEDEVSDRDLGWLEEPVIVGLFFVVPVILLIAGGAILLTARNR